MEKQTAVGYIEDNLKNVKEGYQNIVLGGEEYVNIKHLKYLLEQAKQMEKEQIIKTHLDCWGTNKLSAEDYYNKTFVEDKTFKKKSLWTRITKKQP